MYWGPEDWDTWLKREETKAPPAGPLPHEAALLRFLDRIPGRRGLTVADLGCGSGRLLPLLAERFAKVVAIDYAPASLALARRACAGRPVLLRRRDLRDLTPFRNAFDVAVAVDSILGPRPEDLDRILAQVHGCLVEGGVLAATFPEVSRAGRMLPMRLVGEPKPPEPVAVHEMELQFRMRKAGFEAVRIRRVEARGSRGNSLLCVATRRASN